MTQFTKQQAIYVINNMVKLEEIIMKLEKSFGADIPNGNDLGGLMKNVFGVELSNLDYEEANKYHKMYTDLMDRNDLNQDEKSEQLYDNIISLIKTESNVSELPETKVYNLSGTLRIAS